MVGKLKSLPGACSLVPFVLLSYGQKSQFLWENEEGETRWVEQAEGGEQGDPLMPYLFPSGIHEPFTAVAKHVPIQSVPARVDSAYWNGAEAASMTAAC